MCPFSVTLQHVPDREVGPLLLAADIAIDSGQRVGASSDPDVLCWWRLRDCGCA